MLELYRIEFKEIPDPLLHSIAKSTFEMTIFNFNLCLNSRHHQLIVSLPDSILKEKMFYFSRKKFGIYVSEGMVGGTCEKRKNFKGRCHYLRHKECLPIVCINKNSVACICPYIKH